MACAAARRLRSLQNEGGARERFADDRDARGAGCIVIGERSGRPATGAGLLLGTVHDMMLVVALLVVELTAKQNDKTSAEERMRLFRTKTFREGIETFTRTIARRLRDLCDGGEESENGTVH